MTNAFVNNAAYVANATVTENGHDAASSTGSAVLDLYGQVGGLRDQDFDSRVRPLFRKAIAADKLLAAKTMFYARDARGGTGERQLFRNMLAYAAKHNPEIVRPNIKLIPFYGRWDDMYALVGTPLEDDMWAVVKSQLKADTMAIIKAAQKQEAPSISLMGKWLKSCNSSSKETCRLGRLTAKKLGYTEREYRQTLSMLRTAIRIVEQKMSANKWSDIEYDKIPSRAGTIYREAFRRHDGDRYNEFIDAVTKGEKKINAAMNTPQDLVHAYTNGNTYYGHCHIEPDPTIEAMWKNLPDFVQSDENILCMVDVSGSMQGRPVEISAGLGMYFAQRNRGAFHNLFMTFESVPSFVMLNDNATFAENLATTMMANWGGSTDLNRACEQMLQFAIDHNVPDKDMPTRLVIISDMEIDQATGHYRRYENDFDAKQVLHIDELKAMYAGAGYTMPQVIYWNAESRDNHFQTKSDVPGTMLASGSSPAIFKAFMEMKDLEITPLDSMLEVLNGERYAQITVE